MWLTPRFWWHNPLHIGIFSDAQANDIDNALTVATMGTGQEPSERGIGAGPWLLERSPHLQRLASHARFMGASTDKGTLRRERTMEHSLEPQCEPSRKRHLAESATRARPSRPRAAIRKAYLTGLVDVAGQLFVRHRGWDTCGSLVVTRCLPSCEVVFELNKNESFFGQFTRLVTTLQEW